MFNEKQLRDAAKEMNTVMVGLEPPINVKGKVADLVAEIKEAIEYIDPKDEFTEATQKVIDDLSGDAQEKAAERMHKANIEEAPVKGGAPEEEEELMDLEEEEEEEEEKPAPPKKKTAPPPRTANGYLRVDAICDALKDKPKSVAEWITLANTHMVKHGGRANDNENKALIKLVSKVISHVSKSTSFPTE